MARPRSADQPLSKVVAAGAIQVYNDSYARNGRGARGRAAAERALERSFPGIGQQTIDAVTRRADAARQTASRQARAGPNYVTPIQGHVEVDCPRTSPVGQARTRQYRYTVDVQVTFTGSSGNVFTHTFTYTFDFNAPPSLGSIQAMAERSARAEATIRLGSPGMKRRGTSGFTIDSSSISGSFTCLT